MINEEQLLKKRFNELSLRADTHGFNTFTDFLNIDEQSVLSTLKLSPTLFGGYENAERVVARFGENKGNFPITIIKVTPSSKKFADKLTHRDFLGTLMGLGIKRETLGDIIIIDNSGYVFCLENISGYIVEQLERVRHTTVKCQVVDSLPESAQSEVESTEIIVSSERLDVLVANVYKLSRNDALKLFAQGKIFVNSKMTENNSATLSAGDIVSVRGFGKFIYDGQLRQTKKNRLVVSVKIL